METFLIALSLGPVLGFGFGGEGSVTALGVGDDSPMNGGLTLGANADIALGSYAAVGAQILWTSWSTNHLDGQGVDDSSTWSFGLVVRGRAPEIIAGETGIEPYLAVPFGRSLTLLADGFGDANGYEQPDAGGGWHWGVAGGARLRLGERPWQPWMQLGWMDHGGVHDADGIEVRTNTAQLQIRMGVAFGL